MEISRITQQTDCIIQGSPEKQNQYNVQVHRKRLTIKELDHVIMEGSESQSAVWVSRLETSEVWGQIEFKGSLLENSLLNREANLFVLFRPQ